MSKELNNAEKEFVKAISEYETPAVKDSGYFITSLKEIDVDDPERKEKLAAYRYSQRQTWDVIKKLETAVNNFGVDIDGIVEAVKANGKGAYANLVQLSYEWVDMWDKAEEWRTDGRNEASTKLCKEMAQAIKNSNEGKVTNETYYADLDKASCEMHKTLVQTATKMLAGVLRDNDKSVKKIMEDKGMDKNVYLPLI